MMRTLNTAATGMMAQQTNLDTIANNLSNVNTTGFKAQRAEFQDLMYQTFKISGSPTGSAAEMQPNSLQVGMGVKFSGTAVDLSTGAPVQTNNPLNLAINGNGFFKVSMPDGTFSYTRDGSFTLDANGDLVTSDGMLLSPKVTVPQGAESVTIGSDGTVSYVKAGESSATVLTQITVTNFTNPAGLQRIGNNLYTATGASGSPQDFIPGLNGTGTLESGYVEGSNVQVVNEMVSMISAQRAYEINSKAISTADDLLSTVNGMKR